MARLTGCNDRPADKMSSHWPVNGPSHALNWILPNSQDLLPRNAVLTTYAQTVGPSDAAPQKRGAWIDFWNPPLKTLLPKNLSSAEKVNRLANSN